MESKLLASAQYEAARPNLQGSAAKFSTGDRPSRRFGPPLTVETGAHEVQWLTGSTAPGDENPLLDGGAALPFARSYSELCADRLDHRTDIGHRCIGDDAIGKGAPRYMVNHRQPPLSPPGGWCRSHHGTDIRFQSP